MWSEAMRHRGFHGDSIDGVVVTQVGPVDGLFAVQPALLALVRSIATAPDFFHPMHVVKYPSPCCFSLSRNSKRIHQGVASL